MNAKGPIFDFILFSGKDVVSLIEMRPDSFIQKIATGWQHMFDTQKAKNVGFAPDESFENIIRAHITDELDGKIVGQQSMVSHNCWPSPVSACKKLQNKHGNLLINNELQLSSF